MCVESATVELPIFHPRRPYLWFAIGMVLLLLTTIVLLVIGLSKDSTGNISTQGIDPKPVLTPGVMVNPMAENWSITVTNKGRATKGELIFSDEFQCLDLDTWSHEISMSGGGNWEFQLYHNNRSNSYVRQGILYIKPTLTADRYGEAFLTSGHLQLDGGGPDRCTNPLFFGCERRGTPTNIINPIMSARLNTMNSFSFKYGRVEVKAKLPAGDWLWPAIWMMPEKNQYGSWPASGEIDIMESRGNKALFNAVSGVNIGVEQFGSTLHYGPYPSLNGWSKAHYNYNSKPGDGFDKEFHVYGLEWTPEHLKFSIDNREVGTVKPGKGGFWDVGEFPKGTDMENPWVYGENAEMAPFDQKFYLILNLAVGGTNGYFPDNIRRPETKPWKNNSPQAMLDFWNGRKDWLPTWRDEDSALQVDYVRVWAL